MVEANKRMFDQNIQNNMSMQEATDKYDENTRRIYAWAAQVGISKEALDGLIGSMNSVPDTVNSRMVFEGLQESIDRLDSLLRKLNNLPYIKEVRVKYIETVERIAGGGASEGRRATGGISGAAGGGTRSGLTWVGEQGRELVRLPYGSQVYSNPDSERMAAAGSPPSTPAGGLTMHFVGDTDRAFATAFMRLVRERQIIITPN
jgi:hypothetical protein